MKVIFLLFIALCSISSLVADTCAVVNADKVDCGFVEDFFLNIILNANFLLHIDMPALRNRNVYRKDAAINLQGRIASLHGVIMPEQPVDTHFLLSKELLMAILAP